MPERVHILPLGEWKGHPQGEQTYTEIEAQAMVDYGNFVIERANGKPIMIDYEHASLSPSGEGAPASGWMYKFYLDTEAENPGIYADVEWTPRAKKMIDEKEYKYISPVIVEPSVDPVTGEQVPYELFNAALTNVPFMYDKIAEIISNAVKAKHGEAKWYTNQHTIHTNINGGNMPELKEMVDQIISASPLPDGSSPDDLVNWLKKAGEMLAMMPGAPVGEVPTDEGMQEMKAAMTRTITNAKAMDSVAEYLGVDPDKVLAKVTAMSSKADNSDKLAERLAELETKHTENEIEKLLVANERKFPPAKREFWQNYAKKHGVDAARTVLSEMTDIIPSKKPETKENNRSEQPSAEFIAFRKRKGVSDEQIVKEWKNLNSDKEAK